MLSRRSPQEPRAAAPQSSLGKRIVAARKRAGLTQADLAKTMGRDRSLISHLERGNMGNTAGTIALIARALGVSTDYLLGLTDKPVDEVADLRTHYEGLCCLLADSSARVDRLADSIERLIARIDKRAAPRP